MAMTTEPSHLTASATQLLSESNASRIRAVRAERWVHYARASHVLQILNRLLDHPRKRCGRDSIDCWLVGEADLLLLDAQPLHSVFLVGEDLSGNR